MRILDLGRPRPDCFSDSHSLTLPVTLPGIESGDGSQSEEQHWNTCQGHLGQVSSCARCRFQAGFNGMLRRGSSTPVVPSISHSWAEKFTFAHPNAGRKTWLVARAGKAWSMGCWVCAHFPAEKCASTFARLAVTDMNSIAPSAFQKHEKSASHQASLEIMRKQLCESDQKVEESAYTALSDAVPRLEKFHMAGQIIATHSSFNDYKEFIKSASVSSPLSFSTDMSRQAVAKMIVCLARPLHLQDLLVIRKASVASLAMDVRQDLMLVRARFWYTGLTNNAHLPACGLYDCILGCEREQGTGARASAQSVKRILENACTVRSGQRGTDFVNGPEDALDEHAFEHLKEGPFNQAGISLGILLLT